MNNEFFKRIVSSIILIPVVIFLIIKGGYYFNFFISICLIMSFYEWNSMSKNKEYKILGIIFLIISFYSAYHLRNKVPGNYIYFLLILLICIFTDIGGYIFGKVFKGPKLTKISPKKTYAGVIGGYVCSISFIILFYSNSSYLTKYLNFDFIDLKDSFMLFILAFIISSVSQLGDIIVSYFKRKTKIKNTGNIIPGHGGLLDRIDGMVFAFPASFLLYKILF